MLQLSSGGRYIKGAKANHTISRHYCISKISLLRADKMTSGLFYLDTLIGGYGCERLLKGGINKGRGNNSLIMPNILLHCIAHGRTRSGRGGVGQYGGGVRRNADRAWLQVLVHAMRESIYVPTLAQYLIRQALMCTDTLTDHTNQ